MIILCSKQYWVRQLKREQEDLFSRQLIHMPGCQCWFKLGIHPKLWAEELGSLPQAAWASSQHGGRVPKVHILREQGGRAQHFCELACNIVEHHIHDILLLKVVTGLEGKWHGLLIGSSKAPKMHVGLEMLLWPSLENTIRHT